jgi:acetolactate synthase I/II/III large subunit
LENISAIITRHFKEWGITHVFGLPGKPVVPLLMELENQGIPFVLSRHETGAGFSASGYSLLKGGLGVAIGTSGPGGTNLLTAAAQAKAYHAPTLFLTGQPSGSELGKSVGQDSSSFGTDLVKMFTPVTLFSARVERADQLELLLRHALERATTGRKGPVHLSIPMDVLLDQTSPFTIPFPSTKPSMVSSELENVVKRLQKAKSPLLFLGKGVHLSKAYDQVQWLAETWQIPVATTPGGKGSFSTTHPLSLGAFGLGGNEAATRYLIEGVDELIVIGSTLSDMSLAGFTRDMYPAHVIQFDIDAIFVNKSLLLPTLLVLGDAKHNLYRLQQMMGSSILATPKRKLISVRDNEIGSASIHVDSSFLSAKRAIKVIRDILPFDTVFFGDDGSHTFYAIEHLELPQPGTFFFDDVFGAMGHAIGYAIGAKLGDPEKSIVCLTGDGCCYMHGTEIATAVDEKLPLLFIVFNNKQLDMVDKGMKQWFGTSTGATYSVGLDVCTFARSLGATAYYCENDISLRSALQESVLMKAGPSVIEVMVDPNEIPPILNRV